MRLIPPVCDAAGWLCIPKLELGMRWLIFGRKLFNWRKSTVATLLFSTLGRSPGRSVGRSHRSSFKRIASKTAAERFGRPATSRLSVQPEPWSTAGHCKEAAA